MTDFFVGRAKADFIEGSWEQTPLSIEDLNSTVAKHIYKKKKKKERKANDQNWVLTAPTKRLPKRRFKQSLKRTQGVEFWDNGEAGIQKAETV